VVGVWRRLHSPGFLGSLAVARLLLGSSTVLELESPKLHASFEELVGILARRACLTSAEIALRELVLGAWTNAPSLQSRHRRLSSALLLCHRWHHLHKVPTSHPLLLFSFLNQRSSPPSILALSALPSASQLSPCVLPSDHFESVEVVLVLVNVRAEEGLCRCGVHRSPPLLCGICCNLPRLGAVWLGTPCVRVAAYHDLVDVPVLGEVLMVPLDVDFGQDAHRPRCTAQMAPLRLLGPRRGRHPQVAGRAHLLLGCIIVGNMVGIF